MSNGPKFAERINAAALPESVRTFLKQEEAILFLLKKRREFGLPTPSAARNQLLVDFPPEAAHIFAELYVEICREYTQFSESYPIRLSELIHDKWEDTLSHAREVFGGTDGKVVIVEDANEFFSGYGNSQEEQYIVSLFYSTHASDPNAASFVVPISSSVKERDYFYGNLFERLHPQIIDFE